MRAINLPRAIADPQHVSRRRPPLLAGLVEARQRLLVVEQQRLMAGEHLDRARRLLEADLTVHFGQVGIGCRGIGLKQFDGDLRLAMRGQQALGIGHPRRSRKVGAVDRVAAITGQRNPVDCFAARRSRLGKLTGDPGEMNDIAAARGAERGAHPQQ